MVVRRIKIWKRRGDLKLAVFSYRKPNPWLLIPAFKLRGSSLRFGVWGLNDASGHRPITIYGEAATFIPNS